jgi:hypothetical protein
MRNSITSSLTLVDGVAQDTLVDNYILAIRADIVNTITVSLKMQSNGTNGFVDSQYGIIATIPAGQLYVSPVPIPRGMLRVTGGSAFAVLSI